MPDKYSDIIAEQWRLYPDIMRSYTGRAGPESPPEPPKLPEPEPEPHQKIGDKKTLTSAAKCGRMEKILFAPVIALARCIAVLKLYSADI